jgi:hypothetical protein
MNITEILHNIKIWWIIHRCLYGKFSYFKIVWYRKCNPMSKLQEFFRLQIILRYVTFPANKRHDDGCRGTYNCVNATGHSDALVMWFMCVNSFHTLTDLLATWVCVNATSYIKCVIITGCNNVCQYDLKSVCRTRRLN